MRAGDPTEDAAGDEWRGRRLRTEQERVRVLSQANKRVKGLLGAVVAISREVELQAVLRRIVTTAMEVVDARGGALGVLSESGDELEQFITVGLSKEEIATLAGVEFPYGAGQGAVIRRPEPPRTDEVHAHPASVEPLPGRPARTLLGVAISVRGEVCGDLYLSDRRDGRRFDREDEDVIVALAGAAGIAIENARLFNRVRDSAVRFQRLLLPSLPELPPFDTAAVYRPAADPGRLGGDWYDAILLPDATVGVVIGDVVGHDLDAAAAMAQTRSMLRALLYERRKPPGTVLGRLDEVVMGITDLPVTTACLARIEPRDSGVWALHWSSAGHVPPLVVTPDGRTEYLEAEPGLPLGVDTSYPRPDHTRVLPRGATVILFTDGLIEDPRLPLDTGLTTLADLAAAHARLPLQRLVDTLADRSPGDGHDDMAILAVRTPDG